MRKVKAKKLRQLARILETQGAEVKGKRLYRMVKQFFKEGKIR